MRGLVFFVQLLFWLLVIRLVLRAFRRTFAPSRPRPGAAPASARIEDLVQDPVCRAYLPRSRVVSARIAGREEHFCSAACRDKALAAVARAS